VYICHRNLDPEPVIVFSSVGIFCRIWLCGPLFLSPTCLAPNGIVPCVRASLFVALRRPSYPLMSVPAAFARDSPGSDKSRCDFPALLSTSRAAEEQHPHKS